MYSVTLARSVADLEKLRSRWQRLYASGKFTFFQDFDWNLLAARAFAGREEPCVVYAEVEGGAALIPACVNGRSLGLLGETLFDYRDVLAEGDLEALDLAWAKLAELGLPLSMTAVRNGAATRRWSQLQPQPFCHAPAVSPADIDADAFRAQHTGIGRHVRRLQRAGGEMHCHPGTETAVVRRVLELKAQHAAEDNLLRDPVRRDFLCAAAALHPGQCDVYTFDVAGDTAAGLLTFRDAETRRFYTIVINPRWAGYSPGNALLLEVTHGALAEGLTCDYMTGEQPYKLRFATRNVPLYRVEASAEGLDRLLAATSAQRAA